MGPTNAGILRLARARQPAALLAEVRSVNPLLEESLIVLARVPSAPSAGTVELPQHVLVKGVVNISLDPIQTADALLELFRQRMKNAPGTP